MNRDQLIEYEKWCVGELKEIPGYTRECRSMYITLCVINTLFALSSAINNSLVITVLTKTSVLHKPSYILLFLLAFSDQGVGCIVQPMYIFKQFLVIQGTDHYEGRIYCSADLIYLSVSRGTVLSFLTIAAASFDRHLAVRLRNRYAINVTKKRMSFVVFCTLALSAIPHFIILLATNGRHIANIAIVTSLPMCFIITTFHFFKVHQALRRQRNLIHVYPVTTGSLRRPVEPNGPLRNAGSERYTRAMKSMTYVFGAVVLCYLPVMILWPVNAVLARNTYMHLALHITGTIVYVNSSLNPLLYYWRIPEIREAVVEMLGLKRNQWNFRT